jgi:HPt (histidine-containing phosphotransfer) domain-containing protein
LDYALYGDKEVKFMNLEELYISLHGDYADAKARLMNDRLVEKFVLKFPSDPSMQQLREAVVSGDNAAAFRAVHTLKGVAANLSFSELRKAASDLTEQLRGCDKPADAELLKKLEEAYKLVIDSIKAFTI